MNPMVGNYPLSSEKRRPATQDAFKMHDMIEKPNLSRSGWRRMSEDDLASVFSIADRVHSSYPEDEAVFADFQLPTSLESGGEAAACLG